MLNGIGGRTIEEAQGRLSAREFHAWIEFYRLFPFDDFHRYHRPAAAVAGSFGGKTRDVLEWLSPAPEEEVQGSKYSKADLTTMNTLLSLGRPHGERR